MCKTKDYSISSALDYRKGKNGHQEHIFQLNITKDHDIQFWINHPGEKELNGAGRPSYWAGNGTVPMVEQYENNVFLMFRISEDQMVDFTHAYCPFEDFDEYIFRGNTLFLSFYSLDCPLFVEFHNFLSVFIISLIPVFVNFYHK